MQAVLLRRTLALPRHARGVATDVEAHLRQALKESMRARDTTRTSIIKSVLGDVQTASKLPNAPSAIKVIRTAIKRREEGIEAFLKSSSPRQDMADSYAAEVTVLNEFIKGVESPKMDLTELAKLIEEAIASQGKAMGPVVKEVMRLAQGKAEGKDVALAVKRALQ